MKSEHMFSKARIINFRGTLSSTIESNTGIRLVFNVIMDGFL